MSDMYSLGVKQINYLQMSDFLFLLKPLKPPPSSPGGS